MKLLARIGPAIIWIGALLAALLGLDRLFQADREDGSLDIMLMRGDFAALAGACFMKCLAHWTATCLPLVIAAPLLGLLMNMEPLATGSSFLFVASSSVDCVYETRLKLSICCERF